MKKKYKLSCGYFINNRKLAAISIFNNEPTENDVAEFYNNIPSSIKYHSVELSVIYEVKN